MGVRALLRTADVHVVRSWQEASFIEDVLGEAHPFIERFIAVPAIIERPGEGEAKTILIWAPHHHARACALTLFALAEFHAPIVVICAGGADEFAEVCPRATFLASADVANVKGLAAIVVPDHRDPAPSVALVEWGTPLAVATTSGAREYISGANAFTPWDFHSIRDSVATAIGSVPPFLRGELPSLRDLQRQIRHASIREIGDPPLVSIVVATKNRRGVLPRALEAVRHQTYSNIELIVINDGGCEVSDLLPDAPNVRYIVNPTSLGLERVIEQSVRVASGKYMCTLNDDDVFTPDYITKHVFALERTGGVMARGLTISRILERSDGAYFVLGYDLHTPLSVDVTEMLYRNTNGASPLYLTDMLRQHAEPQIAAGHLSDHEWYLRYLEHFDFTCVRAVTACIDIRTDGTNFSTAGSLSERRTRLATDYQVLYRAHPLDSRPAIDAIRAWMIEYVSTRYEGTALPKLRFSAPVKADFDAL